MTKKYRVFEGVSGGAYCEVSKDDYEKATPSREVVVAAFNIEETFIRAAQLKTDRDTFFADRRAGEPNTTTTANKQIINKSNTD